MANARRTALPLITLSLATTLLPSASVAARKPAPTPAAQAAAPAADARQASPLAAEALRLPRETALLTGLDVRRFVASRFYKKFGQPGATLRPTALDELQRLTGINAEADLDRLFVARGSQNELAILAIGRFDRPRLEAAWRARPQSSTPIALGFPSARTLVVGTPAWVERVSAKAAGEPLGANATLTRLVSQVRGNPAFWMVGEGGALAQLNASGARSGGASGMPLGLPALKSIAMTGDFDELTTLVIEGEAENASAAQSLADTLRGFLALAALQAQRKPALADLPAALSTTVDGTRVRLTGRFTDALLEALLPGNNSASGANPPPPPPADPQPKAPPAR
jgi:hypothetical protein